MVMVKRTYLHIAVVTLVTAVIWMLLSIYQSLTAVNDVNVDPVISTPINATLDQATLDNLILRENLKSLPFEPPKAETVSINQVEPVASESATVTPTENPL